MIILGIETSCDETAIALIESADGRNIRVLADKTLSQIELHKQYGGVFPNMAKREHSRNLVPLLKVVLEEGFGNPKSQISNHKQTPREQTVNLEKIFEKERDLLKQFLEVIPTIGKPQIDAIAVTEGPGLEPCLWTGINLAKALSLVWNIPVIPVNHMEGHIFSALLRAEESTKSQAPNSKQTTNSKLKSTNKKTTHYSLHTAHFPALALLISGGHTELVLIKGLGNYEIIGQTRDDAVGEAFDKVARLLGLPYPGGPQISALAEEARTLADNTQNDAEKIRLPRPMLHSKDFDFSFSGLKTAVLYLLKKLSEQDGVTPVSDSPREVRVSRRLQSLIAREFENAVTEVLVAKTKAAIEQYGAKTLLIGGGVIANTHIRRAFEDLENSDGRRDLLNGLALYIPEPELTTDNALMIAVAGAIRFAKGGVSPQTASFRAQGNLRLAQNTDL